jgi:PAS domain S-box-containing protein
MAKSLNKIIGDSDISLKAFQVLADNSFDSVLITDATKAGKIIYANKAFNKLTGYSVDEVIGKTPRILQGSATDKMVLERLSKSLRSGKHFEGSAINYKKNGKPFIMHWRVVPAKIGKNTKVWLAIQREGTTIN